MKAGWCWLVVGAVAAGMSVRASDLIEVSAKLVPLSTQIESASQEQLAAWVRDAESVDTKVVFESRTVVRSGNWVESQKSQTFRYPTEYEKAQFIQGKSDRGIFSLPADHYLEASSVFLPPQANKFASRDLGSFFSAKATLVSNEGVRISGTFRHEVLVSLATERLSPPLTYQKRAKSPKVWIGQSEIRMPVFHKDQVDVNGVVRPGRPLLRLVQYSESIINRGSSAASQSQKVEYIGNWDSKEVSLAEQKVRSSAVLVVNAEKVTSVPENLAPQGDAIQITSRFLEADSPMSVPNPILSGSEFHQLLAGVSEEENVDVLSAPEVVMRPSRDGKIEVIREFIYPTQYDPPEMSLADIEKAFDPQVGFPVTPSTPVEFTTENTGVTLNVTGRLLNSGAVQLTAKTLVSDFEGFINYGAPVMSVVKNGIGKPVPVVLTENRIEMPVFSHRKLESTTRVPNGATWYVGNLRKIDYQDVSTKMLGVITSEQTIAIPRYLHVFVTVERVKLK